MAFERKFSGATEFLRASKRAAPRTPASGPLSSAVEEETTAAFDGAVMNALLKLECDSQEIASAINVPPATVEGAIARLIDQGFVAPAAKGKPCELTDAGRRYLKYSQLTKY